VFSLLDWPVAGRRRDGRPASNPLGQGPSLDRLRRSGVPQQFKTVLLASHVKSNRCLPITRAYPSRPINLPIMISLKPRRQLVSIYRGGNLLLPDLRSLFQYHSLDQFLNHSQLKRSGRGLVSHDSDITHLSQKRFESLRPDPTGRRRSARL
jgi:hypothetical protein